MTQRQTNAFKKIAAVAGLALSLTLTATQAFATFPDKPIQFISPFAAGGANDYLTRLMAQHMATELKGTIVAENKTGANGIVGATFVAKSAPDGYTARVPHQAQEKAEGICDDEPPAAVRGCGVACQREASIQVSRDWRLT